MMHREKKCAYNKWNKRRIDISQLVNNVAFNEPFPPRAPNSMVAVIRSLPQTVVE